MTRIDYLRARARSTDCQECRIDLCERIDAALAAAEGCDAARIEAAIGRALAAAGARCDHEEEAS